MSSGVEHAPAFTHRAVLYSSDSEFMARVGSFVIEGVEAGEPVLVALSQRGLELLSGALGDRARNVSMVDMRTAGKNPARIIQLWAEFLARCGASAPVRGVGEPVWEGRSAAELVECEIHESLLNTAFAGRDSFTLLCPYDAASLPEPVLEGAEAVHPQHVGRDGVVHSHLERSLDPFAQLLEPAPRGEVSRFETGDLHDVRGAALALADARGANVRLRDDFALAVSEVATNSLRHGDAEGTFQLWCDDGALNCEVRGNGVITDPMIGRCRPGPGSESGYGLWLVNQVCDLLQIRSNARGSIVRLSIS
ncbi:MAG TPA: anti-sigma factor RsbA family regulatory protein [Acidimicrobiia bacterium]